MRIKSGYSAMEQDHIKIYQEHQHFKAASKGGIHYYYENIKSSI